MAWRSLVCLTNPNDSRACLTDLPLDGETNVFQNFYDNDLDSDVESVEEAPTPRKKATLSPVRTREEKMEMLRRVARMNKEVWHATTWIDELADISVEHRV